MYYASEQDGVYSYQPLYPSPGSSWPSESKKERVLNDDHHYRQHSTRAQLPIQVHQYHNTNYPVRHPDGPYIQPTTPLIVSSPRLLHSPDIETAYGDPNYDDWSDEATVPVSTSLRSLSLSNSNSRTIPPAQPQARYPTSPVKQEDISVFTPQGYFAAPQPHHALPPDLVAFDLQSLYSGNSSYDGSGPSSHHGTPTPMQSLPLPTPHSYGQSSSMAHMYETLPQDCYMHEVSPSEPSAPSLSPQLGYSPGCDPRFISGTQETACHNVDQSCLVDEESEQSIYEIERHKAIHLQGTLTGSNHGFKTNTNGAILAADTESDVDAEGEDDPFDQVYQDDGEPDIDRAMVDDSKEREYAPRRGRSSSSDASTAHATPPAHQGRTLRSRSVSGPRFSPYQYSPQQSLTYGRGSRTRRATTASLSGSSSQTGSFLSDQQDPSSSPSSPPPTPSTSRKRTRPATPLPIPIPVPNLTKKSRGRGVPTIATLEMSGRGRGCQTFGEDEYTESGKRRNGARLYTCNVPGCGKCFARGEHLKRHVRSIHTYEKRASTFPFCFGSHVPCLIVVEIAHKCPYPGCGKDFSRHDNLGQHMRVHKDYVPPKDSRAYRV